jgi:hypothetical protein
MNQLGTRPANTSDLAVINRRGVYHVRVAGYQFPRVRSMDLCALPLSPGVGPARYGSAASGARVSAKLFRFYGVRRRLYKETEKSL